MLLKPHHAPKDWLTRVMDCVVRLASSAGSTGSSSAVRRATATASTARSSASRCALVVYAGLLGAGLSRLRGGAARLRAGAGQAVSGQLRAVAQRRHARAHGEGDPRDVGHRAQGARRRKRRGLPGPVDQRLHQQRQRRHRLRDPEAVRGAQDGRASPASPSPQKLQAEVLRHDQDAFIAIFPPPPVQGLGTIGGFKLQVEDRTDLGYEALDAVDEGRRDQGASGARARRRLLQLRDQRAAALRRSRPHQGAASSASTCRTCSTTMQIYLGSLYVNDFNRFGRTYQVIAQADTDFRSRPEDILQPARPATPTARWCRWAP